jgi:hypothetical protein
VISAAKKDVNKMQTLTVNYRPITRSLNRLIGMRLEELDDYSEGLRRTFSLVMHERPERSRRFQQKRKIAVVIFRNVAISVNDEIFDLSVSSEVAILRLKQLGAGGACVVDANLHQSCFVEITLTNGVRIVGFVSDLPTGGADARNFFALSNHRKRSPFPEPKVTFFLRINKRKHFIKGY